MDALTGIAVTVANLFLIPLAGAWLLYRIPAVRRMLFH
jgi:hypothetical protein